MITKKPAVVLVCAAAAAAFFLCNSHVQSESQNAQMRVGGTFIGNGAAGLWSSFQAPLDPAGRTAAVRVNGIAMPGFAPLLAVLEADTFAEMVGQSEMISRDTSKYNLIGYATEGTTVKAILQMTGAWKFEGPDKALVSYSISVFAPSADADNDGLPDAGATPIMPPIQGADYAKRVSP